MSILTGKRDFGDLDGQTVSYVERNVSRERADFLKKIMEHNNIPALVLENPPAEEGGAVTYTVATPDLVFNPVIYVYERRLRTLNGRRISPAYWNQETESAKPEYWEG